MEDYKIYIYAHSNVEFGRKIKKFVQKGNKVRLLSKKFWILGLPTYQFKHHKEHCPVQLLIWANCPRNKSGSYILIKNEFNQ